MTEKAKAKAEEIAPEEADGYDESDYEDQFPDDLPSDKELYAMVTGDATKFGLISCVIVGLAIAIYLGLKFYS